MTIQIQKYFTHAIVSSLVLMSSFFQPVEVKQYISTSCWMEVSDLMTEVKVLGDFQVSLNLPTPQRPGGLHPRVLRELSGILARLLSFNSDRSWRGEKTPKDKVNVKVRANGTVWGTTDHQLASFFAPGKIVGGARTLGHVRPHKAEDKDWE